MSHLQPLAGQTVAAFTQNLARGYAPDKVRVSRLPR